jgi:hypothetical protein
VLFAVGPSYRVRVPLRRLLKTLQRSRHPGTPPKQEEGRGMEVVELLKPPNVAGLKEAEGLLQGDSEEEFVQK